MHIAPPSPKHPKFFDGKNEVHPISPIVPVFTIEPLSSVYSDPMACALSSITDK